jgi:hypothetical protein
MSEGPFPKTFKEALPYITWGSLIFTCGFVVIEKVVEQSYGQALAALLLGLAILAVALNSKTWIERTNPNWAFAGALMAVLAILSLPFIEQQRWPFSTSHDSAGVSGKQDLDAANQKLATVNLPPATSALEIANALIRLHTAAPSRSPSLNSSSAR